MIVGKRWDGTHILAFNPELSLGLAPESGPAFVVLNASAIASFVILPSLPHRAQPHVGTKQGETERHKSQADPRKRESVAADLAVAAPDSRPSQNAENNS
jgi:hypothetical protein